MKKVKNILVVFNLLFTMVVLGQTINVDDFGAVGNGVTDDRGAIQSALDNLKSNGGKLQFTSGKIYLIKAGLNFKYCSGDKNYLITTTDSEKAIIKIADGTPITWGHWGIFLHSSKNVTINNLHFDGNRDTRNPTEQHSGTFLIQIYDDCDGLRLNDLILENSVIDNLYIASTDGADSTKFLSDFEMHNCVLRNGWRNNMSVIRGKNFKIIGCEFDNAHGLGDPEAGIDFEPNGGGSYGYKDILVEGCTFKNNRRFGITLTIHDDIDIEGRVTIRNNYFENNGIYLLSQYNIITNNVFRKVDHKPVINSTGVERTGIIVFSPWTSITGNKIYNNYFYDNPLPDGQHLIGLSSSTGPNNEIYSNYSYNNNIEGFISNKSPNDQVIHDNVELKRKETGYWNMDSDSISGNSIFDLSDFHQTGTLHNEPTIVNGQYNEALDFSPDNKNIDIPIKEILNMRVNLTISAWVNWKGTSSESEQVIVGKDGDWRFGLDNSGKVGFHGESKNETTYTGGLTESSETLPTGSWTHVAVTYNGRATTVYINGVNSGSKESIGNLSASSLKISIGSLLGESSSFNGSIDDVKIFNYGLSESEIDSLYRIVSGHNKTKPVGLGTEVSPYEINTLVNLSWLAQTPEEWNAYYIQTSDIDASKTSMWDDSDDNGDGDKYNDLNDKTEDGNNEGWYPIGNSTQKFTGTYDGKGYEIKNLTIKNRTTEGNGFFGEVEGGIIQNVGLTNIDIEGSNRVGGLVAVCSNNKITNSYTTGKIVCVDAGTNGYSFGGLVGKAFSTTINSCKSKVNLIGSGVTNQRVGGLVGSASSGSEITESYCIGNVETVGGLSGGFVGELSGSSIKQSYSFGTVLKASGSSDINYGGFVGGVKDASVIEHCYSVGMVDNSFSDKGFVGLVLSGAPSFTNNFFDKGTSEQSSSIGAEGKLSEEMMNSNTFVSANWDTTTVWKFRGSYPNLKRNSNKDLEYGGVPGEIPGFNGKGTEEDPYQVARISDLSWVAQNKSAWSSYYIQVSDIDASVTATWDDSDDNGDGNKYNDPNDFTMEGSNDGFSPLGNLTTSFSGVYNGQNYNIRNLVIHRPSSNYVGLFGQIKSSTDKDARVIDLTILNEDITGGGYVGGLVGKNVSGKISNCSCEGKVSSGSSTGYVGGLVGYNIGPTSAISRCYSKVEVSTTGTGSYIGGFAGRNRSYAEINECYSKSNVLSSGDKVGGFVGQLAQGIVKNSYSIGSVTTTGTGNSVGGFCGAVYQGTIEYCYSVGQNRTDRTKGFLGSESNTNVYTNNYIDTLVSECNQSAIPNVAIGKTTTEMQTASTFVGWDFTNVWEIVGDNYPLLTGVKVSVKGNEIDVIPTDYVLEQNYPNPFNPTTVIRFSIPEQVHVKLTVYNVIGEKVAELVNGNMSAGNHEVSFNASNLASGMYVYRISATSATRNFVAVKKMLLLK